MQTDDADMRGFQGILERKEAELDHMLRRRDGIAIEKSADEMDEIQYASERDMAIRNVDRDATLLREVKATLRRIRDGNFGTCIDCESAISSKAPRGGAVGVTLYTVPGHCRSRRVRSLWSMQRDHECSKEKQMAASVAIVGVRVPG